MAFLNNKSSSFIAVIIRRKIHHSFGFCILVKGILRLQSSPKPLNKYFSNTSHQQHVPVMLNEAIQALHVREGQTILDMTFGAGGHTRAILDSTKDTKIIALDRDPLAHDIAKSLHIEYGDRIVPVLGRFSELNTLLPQCGVSPDQLDAALLDAGCSSMQFDIPERGFSIKRNGPLDMRMDGERNDLSAADIVNSLNAEQLQEIFSKYGEEQRSKKIAHAIVNYRKTFGPITTTHQLVDAVESSFNKKNLHQRKDALNRSTHTATKIFMALRIFVNDEYNELSKGLDIIEKYLKPGGHFVALTFHSHEDRIIKRKIAGIPMDKPINGSVKQSVRNPSPSYTKQTKWLKVQEVQMPDMKEKHTNPRCRSAKLRLAIKLPDL